MLSNEPVCPCCGGAVSPLDLLLDARTGSIAYGGQVARLTGTQFRLVRALFEAYPRVLSKDDLMAALYPDPDRMPELKTLDVLTCYARKKLDPIGLTITTHWGVGFGLEMAEDGRAELLRNRRLAESRSRRISFEAPDLPMIKVYRELGYPITDIARRLNLTFRAVMSGLDALEAAKVLPALMSARRAG